jgi:hypothetical protein
MISRGVNTKMKKIHRKEKRKAVHGITGILILLLTLICAIPVNAASEKTVKKAYGKFLSKYATQYTYFKVLNVGTKKEPILLVQNKVDENNGSSYAEVYYYKSGKVLPIKGETIESGGVSYPLRYKKGYIIIPNRWGGITRVQIKSGKTVGDAVYYYLPNKSYFSYTYANGEYYNKKSITKKQFKKYVNKWEGKIIKYVKNNKSNRKKYLGSKK